MTAKMETIPRAFVWRRLHSLMGLWLVMFLTEHLLVNSQAALWIGDDGNGFVRAVNSIQELPYLKVLELVLLGLPFAIHIIWGVQYLWTGQSNSSRSDGSTPSLPEYSRNHAYTWQRITSWVLLIGVIAHVVQMRFVEYPTALQKGADHYYMVRLDKDEGLDTLGVRLGFELYDHETIQQQDGQWLAAFEKHPVAAGQVVAVTKSFGTAELLMVRDTFKMPIMLALYTLFVLAACFHAFNGLWTFMITWGVTLTEASQRLMLKLSTGIMIAIAFLGLAAIWGTYWINLKY